MRIQRKNLADYEVSSIIVGELISELTQYVANNKDYVGHFIIRKDGKPIF